MKSCWFNIKGQWLSVGSASNPWNTSGSTGNVFFIFLFFLLSVLGRVIHTHMYTYRFIYIYML